QVESVLVTILQEGTAVPSPQKESVEPSAGIKEKRGGEILSGASIGFAAASEGKVSPPSIVAMPAVRKLAKNLGVDLSKVRGTGPAGRITEGDVKSAVSGAPESVHAADRFVPISIPKLGPEERIPLRGIRRSIAHHLQMSKYYAPHFSYIEEVDLTDLVKLREKNKEEAQMKGIKLTYLSYIVKALIPALKQFPTLNASMDETTQEVVLKKYYNIGIAVATPDGLVVPVVKGVDQKSLYDVAGEIVRLSDAVKNHKAKPEEMRGSSFTVTSIGSIGGVFATPIINYPDVAILGVNKITERPVVRNGKIVARHILYLSLTLDHRVVDGAVAAEFMNALVKILEKP
ncbi:MAG: dihydrolipoamide acetyltransferase family protein, partial [Deltaproteobacteria bacterium]